MTVFESWKDSLKLCKLESIKLFALVTLKSMKEVVRTLATIWFLAPIILFVLLATLLQGMQGLVGSVSFAFSVASVFFLIAARPSVGLKDFEYFRKNMIRALWLILVSIGIGLLLMLPMMIPFIVVGILLALMPAFFDVVLLFYLDYTDTVWDAFKRAFRMVWYNYPLLIVYIGGAYLLNMLLVAPLSYLGLNATIQAGTITTMTLITTLITNTWQVLFLLFIKCLIVNLYVKRVHDQFDLYK